MLQFSVGTVLLVCFRSKSHVRKISNSVGDGFLIDFSVFIQNRNFSTNFNHYEGRKT